MFSFAHRYLYHPLFSTRTLCIHSEMQPMIAISRSVVMHASLAHLSTEIQTLDAIIRNSTFQTESTSARLPPELLLLIRDHLSPVIIHHLFQRSTAALTQYESTLRSLLCQDCVAYHQDVYGPDIWQWERFSGPCLCSRSPNGYAEAPDYWNSLNLHRRFNDRSSWLEFYLSFEASRLFAHFPSVWDVVDTVLREYHCQIYNRAADPNSSTPSTVSIVPISTSVALFRGPEHTKAALHRATRDLAFTYEYQNGLELWKGEASARPRVLPSKHRFMSPLRARCVCALHGAVDLLTFCLTFPIAFATAILTLLCYYSKPRSLRLI